MNTNATPKQRAYLLKLNPELKQEELDSLTIKAASIMIYKLTHDTKQKKVIKKEKPVAFSHGLKVGDVLYSSWGYEQTNLDFYIIVDASEKSIRIKECEMEKTFEDSQGLSPMSRDIAYDVKTAKAKDSSWHIHDQEGKGDLKRIQYYEYNGEKHMYIKGEFGPLYKYEGKKLYESWYA